MVVRFSTDSHVDDKIDDKVEKRGSPKRRKQPMRENDAVDMCAGLTVSSI